MSERRLERSGVVGGDGDSETSNIRTSYGVFLDRGEDEIIKRIEDRIAAWTLMPAGNGEGLQVLRYQKEQKYDAHVSGRACAPHAILTARPSIHTARRSAA